MRGCLYRFNMKKFVRILILFALCLLAFVYIKPKDEGETAYDNTEFDKVSAFLIYQRQQTEAYYRYCLNQNYRLDNFVNEFNRLHNRQIAAADNFISQFSPAERLAFYQELNSAYAEMQPEMLEQLEQSYDKNRQVFETAGQTFSRTDFCRWMDNHTDILFNGKTDAFR